MADYQTELSQSGTTLYLKPADGFQRSTVMGNSSGQSHQFTGSVLISGAPANQVQIVAGQFEAFVSAGTLSDGNATVAVGASSAGLYDLSASMNVGINPKTFAAAPGRITLTDNTASLFLGATYSPLGGVADFPGAVALTDGTGTLAVGNFSPATAPTVAILSDNTASLSLGLLAGGTALLTDNVGAITLGATWPGIPAGPPQIGSGVCALTDGGASLYVGADPDGIAVENVITLTDNTGSIFVGLDPIGMPADPGTISLTDGTSSFSLVEGKGLMYGGDTYPGFSNITFEVHYTGSGNPVHMGTAGAAPMGGGEVVFFGTGSTTYGSLYYLNTDGGWEMVNANATGSLGTTGAGNASLLGIAQGLNPAAGVLVRGYQEVYSGAAVPGMVSPAWSGAWVTGSAVYIHSGSAGMMSASAPEASNSYVRIVGHCTDTPNVIYFNPDSSWTEIA